MKKLNQVTKSAILRKIEGTPGKALIPLSMAIVGKMEPADAAAVIDVVEEELCRAGEFLYDTSHLESAKSKVENDVAGLVEDLVALIEFAKGKS